MFGVESESCSTKACTKESSAATTTVQKLEVTKPEPVNNTEAVVEMKTASNHGKQYTSTSSQPTKKRASTCLLDEDGEEQTLSWATDRDLRNLVPTPSSLNAADDDTECAPVVMPWNSKYSVWEIDLTGVSPRSSGSTA
ncbi:hypothetical protein GN958_ATG07355 [Phytophthora infestans]|nr:hypothetical protein GN958_ATG07355 [Phytophthora infestans]KAI9990495.1 hypothetical protein PInf_021523 [Phytophthora infestans]